MQYRNLEEDESSEEYKSFEDFLRREEYKHLDEESEENEDEEDEESDPLMNSPTIANELYSTFPEILKKGAHLFSSDREKDVFITMSLAVLSGCLGKVWGLYDKQIVYPNLFAFCIAPSASDKYVLKFARMLAAEIQKEMIIKNQHSEKLYYQELQKYRKGRKEMENEEFRDQPPPIKPSFKVLMIPANSSSSKIIQHLHENDGNGIICETEADTLGNTMKQDWGGFSDMLRKAFHHESVSISRKNDNLYLEVNDPQISVALSGTPGQVASLIKSAEDGLFSRFMFYTYKVKQEWRDVSPTSGHINLTNLFGKLAEEVNVMFNCLNKIITEIKLSKRDWKCLNNTCSEWLKNVTMYQDDEAASLVKRMGLIVFRIAMIFTAMRKYEKNIDCTECDFKSALALGNVYLGHSVLMYANLPKSEVLKDFKGAHNKINFYKALPLAFERKDIIELAGNYEMKPRTLDQFLHKLIKAKKLKKIRSGSYVKVDSRTLQ